MDRPVILLLRSERGYTLRRFAISVREDGTPRFEQIWDRGGPLRRQPVIHWWQFSDGRLRLAEVQDASRYWPRRRVIDEAGEV